MLRDERRGTELRYNVQRSSLFLSRFRSGRTDFNVGISSACEGPLPLDEDRIRLHVLVDRSPAEIFANEGRLAPGGRRFTDEGSDDLELFATGGEARLRSLTVWPLPSPWNTDG